MLPATKIKNEDHQSAIALHHAINALNNMGEAETSKEYFKHSRIYAVMAKRLKQLQLIKRMCSR